MKCQQQEQPPLQSALTQFYMGSASVPELQKLSLYFLQVLSILLLSFQVQDAQRNPLLQYILHTQVSQMNKIETQSVYAEPHTDRQTPFNSIGKTTSRISKVKTDRKHPAGQVLSADEIEKELFQEIAQAEKLIEEVSKALPVTKFTEDGISVEELRLMEEGIRRKNQIIREIEEDIKMLKNGTYFDARKPKDQNPKLTSDLLIKRETLAKVHAIYLEKRREAQKKRQVLRAVEHNFRAKCKKEGIQGLTFEEFKEIQNKKRKEQKRLEKLKKPLKKQISSIREFSNGKLFDNTANESKKMKDLLAKKNVAETALKTAKKRHALEINDLMGKLQFLRDEYHELEEKLLVKEHELRDAESKFSQSRNSVDRKMLLKRYRTQKNL